MSDSADVNSAFDNLCCFPISALARLLIRRQQPFLDELGITYPQYLVLLVLFNEKQLPVRDIGRRLVLNTNTLTPLLKRMEVSGLLHRNRSDKDERVLYVSLSDQGRAIATQCLAVQQSFKLEEPELFAALDQIRSEVEQALEYTSRGLI